MSLIRATRADLGVGIEDAAVYRRKFVMTVYRVLAGGYLRLDATTLAKKQETSITGLLISAMNALLHSRNCPEGAHCFAIHDDHPVSVPGVEGKKRGRIDIFVVDTEPRPRPSFSIEAKRLVDSGSAADYLGEEGLGCFLSGKYANHEPDAGMLGYVQAGEPSEWADRISRKLDKERPEHGLAAQGTIWTPHVLVPQLSHSFRTEHARDGKAFEVFHVLLSCA